MIKTLRFAILLIAFIALVAFGTSTHVFAKQVTPSNSGGSCWGKVVPNNHYAYLSDLANGPKHMQHLIAVSLEERPGTYSFRAQNTVHVYESWNGTAGPYTDLGYFDISYSQPVYIGDYTIYQIAPTTGGGDLVHFTDWIRSCV